MTLVQPTPEQQLRIRTELNENVDTRAQDLQTIKEWLELQPHLPNNFGEFELQPILISFRQWNHFELLTFLFMQTMAA